MHACSAVMAQLQVGSGACPLLLKHAYCQRHDHDVVSASVAYPAAPSLARVLVYKAYAVPGMAVCSHSMHNPVKDVSAVVLAEQQAGVLAEHQKLLEIVVCSV